MAINYDNLVWRETSPKVWERSVDEIEHFYFAFARMFSGSGRYGFYMTGHLTIVTKIPVGQTREQVGDRLDNSLQQAWLSLRYDCPTLAAQVIQRSDNELVKVNKVCETEAEREAWLERTLVQVRNGQTGAQWANSDPPFPELPTLFVLSPDTGTGEVRRDLVIRSPHDIMDGIGTLLLFDNFSKLVDRANIEGERYNAPSLDGSEVKNLSPSYRIAANVPPQLSEDQKKRLAEMTAQKAAAAKAKPGVSIITLPFKRGETSPGRNQREAITIPRDQTSAIVASCKVRNATVTQAYHAAIAIVLRDMQQRGPEPKPAEYVRYILRNERPSCVEPYNTAKHAAAVYHSVSGQALVVKMMIPALGTELDDIQSPERKKEFLHVLQLMTKFYEEVRNDSEHPQLAPFIWGERPLVLPEPGVDPLTRPVPPPSEDPSASISSMGLIDKMIKPDHSSIQVFDPWVTGEELGNGLGLFLGTYRGELCLSTAYNEAWHDRETVAEFLKRCNEVVVAGLGI